MVSLEEFKNEMGSEAEKYSDKELTEILSLQEKLADVLFDSWLGSDQSPKMIKLKNNGKS